MKITVARPSYGGSLSAARLSLACLTSLVASAPLAAQVTNRVAHIAVRVVDTSGQQVAKPYIAVVRDDAAWRDPTTETLAEMPTSGFDVPTGTYRLVVGAKGFATYYGDAMRIDGARDATVHLIRLGTVAGRVVDAADAPIRAARIGLFWEFLDDYPRRLSPLGERYLRSNTYAETDADGLFELPMPIGRSTFVVVEAVKKVPRIIENVSAGSDVLRTVRLEAGATASVTLPADFPRGWLQLAPSAGTAIRHMPPERAMTLWKRRVAAAVTWEALPAGSYDVLYVPEDDEGDTTTLTTFRINPGADYTKHLDAPPRRPIDPPPLTTIAFLLTDRPAGDDRFIITRWSHDATASARARLRHVSGGDILDVAAPCTIGDTFLVETRRSFGAVVMGATDCSSAPTITLHERATVRLLLSGAGSTQKRTGRAVFADCESNHTIVEVPFTTHDAVATITAPAGCVNLLASLRPFAPFRSSKMALDVGSERNLGEWKLISGGEILARVENPDGAPAQGVSVTAYRADDFVPLRDVAEVAAVPPLGRGVTDAKGWVALPGLPQGSLILILRPNGSTYPQFSDLVHLVADERHTVQIRLEQPARLSVSVERPHESTAIEVTSFDLLPTPDNRWPHALAFRERPGLDGTAEFRSVPPGGWRVRAIGHVGGSTSLVVGSRDLVLLPSAVRTESIALSAVTARGHVTRGGSPVEGMLTLTPLSPSAGSITAKVDADGAFVTVAPEEGVYRAVVAEPGKQTVAARDLVHVAAGEEIAIVLATGRIEGRVIDDRGGVESARIHAVARVGASGEEIVEAHAVSRSDGTFVVEGVRDAQWTVTASTDDRTSNALTVMLGDGETRSGAVLHLRPKGKVTGRLLSEGVPVSDAIVSAIFPPPLAEIASGLVTKTNENGEFTLSLPPDAPELANVLVRTRDHIAFAARLPLVDGMTLTIPPSLGQLRLSRRSAPWTRESLALHALVASDGAYVNPLAAGSIGADGVVTTARLPSQRYRYVIARSAADLAVLESGGGALLPAVATITVAPNTTTQISIDDAALH